MQGQCQGRAPEPVMAPGPGGDHRTGKLHVPASCCVVHPCCCCCSCLPRPHCMRLPRLHAHTSTHAPLRWSCCRRACAHTCWTRHRCPGTCSQSAPARAAHACGHGTRCVLLHVPARPAAGTLTRVPCCPPQRPFTLPAHALQPRACTAAANLPPRRHPSVSAAPGPPACPGSAARRHLLLVRVSCVASRG
jgi:hypothetical protein